MADSNDHETICRRSHPHMTTDPKYSVCICNYNMGDTIERALRSVLDQLDEQYEVLVVDDGSSDNSREVLARLSSAYSLLRVIELPRDRKRQLGETRNFSVREARGEYVILHVDADDVWEAYIRDFTAVFHRIEACLGRDVLVSGQQINIGKRDFLMRYGPYRNTHRAQDRDMWLRLAAVDAYIPLDHRVFRTRLPRPKKVQYFKSIRDTWFHMMYDLRRGTAVPRYIKGCLTGFLFPSKYGEMGFKVRLIRFLLILPAYIYSRFQEPLPPPENMRTHAEFVAYRERMRGTFRQIMERAGCDKELSFLSEPARSIFEPGAKQG